MMPTRFYLHDYWRGSQAAVDKFGAKMEAVNGEEVPVIEIPNLFEWLLKHGGAVQLRPPSEDWPIWTLYYSYDGRFGMR